MRKQISTFSRMYTTVHRIVKASLFKTDTSSRLQMLSRYNTLISAIRSDPSASRSRSTNIKPYSNPKATLSNRSSFVAQTSSAFSILTKAEKLQIRYLCSARQQPVLTLYTKDVCPLCDEALDVLEPFLDQVKLEKVDITDPQNRDWWKAYRYDIPVFHLDGKFLMKHEADIETFKKALSDYHRATKDS